jgi:hypothetical protein
VAGGDRCSMTLHNGSFAARPGQASVPIILHRTPVRSRRKALLTVRYQVRRAGRLRWWQLGLWALAPVSIPARPAGSIDPLATNTLQTGLTAILNLDRSNAEAVLHNAGGHKAISRPLCFVSADSWRRSDVGDL